MNGREEKRPSGVVKLNINFFGNKVLTGGFFLIYLFFQKFNKFPSTTDHFYTYENQRKQILQIFNFYVP